MKSFRFCGMVSVLILAVHAAVAAEPAKLAWLDISEKPLERPGDLSWLMGSEDSPTLREIVDAVIDAGDDATCRGLVIRLKDAELKASQVEEIGHAIARVRQGGKKVHIFSEDYGNTGLMLGSYADEIIVQRGGEVSLPGIYMEEMFLADTLAWAGIKADFVQIGDYKGASEMMARSAPSPQWDSNISSLLDSMYAHLRDPIKQGRHLTDAQLDTAMSDAWMADASEATRLGLIDAQADLPELANHLAKRYGGEVTFDRRTIGTPGQLAADTANPFGLLAKLGKQPENKPKSPTIAVLYVDGAIIDGESKGGLGEGEVGSRSIRNAIEDILAEDLIKGVIVRIDSPGGSAVASEIIWQGLKRVAEKKPVWVSVGGMAASGGFYIAVAGERIYVNPSSVVGSIGVVGGKLAMQGLYEKFKINVVARSRGPRASMEGSNAPWTTADLQLVKSRMTKTYDLFTSRVAAGRKGVDLAKTAEGRLFTGEQAVAMKLADKIGGLDEAIDDLAESLKLEDYDVMDYPAPRALGDVLQDMIGGLGAIPGLHAPGVTQAAAFAAMREIIGERAWRQIAPQVRCLMNLREHPVVLVAPEALIWK